MVLNLDSAGMLATSGTTAQPSRSLQSIPAMLDLDAEFLTLFDRLECHSQRRQDQHPPKRLLKVKKEGWHPYRIEAMVAAELRFAVQKV
jgi:hypothetical protein